MNLGLVTLVNATFLVRCLTGPAGLPAVLHAAVECRTVGEKSLNPQLLTGNLAPSWTKAVVAVVNLATAPAKCQCGPSGPAVAALVVKADHSAGEKSPNSLLVHLLVQF